MKKYKNIELYDLFCSFSNDQKSDYKFLSQCIFEKIGISLNAKKLKIKDLHGCWNGLQCKQYPDELAKFLVYIYNNREKINSYCEIGCERGGTFFVVDSFIRSCNSNFTNSLAVDISPAILKHNFKSYAKKFKNVEFLQVDCKDFYPTQCFDLCFIDADHSYNSVKNDFNKMKDFAEIIAFHDIKCPLFNIKKFWNEIDGKIEFLNEDKRFPIAIGIGLYKID